MAPRRLVAPFLALVLGVPVFLATPTPAAAACYGQPGYRETSRVVNGSATATWTGTVTYQIGYTCSGQRSEVLIDTFTQKMKFTGAIHPKVWHADSLAGVLAGSTTSAAAVTRSRGQRALISAASRTAL